MLHSAGAASEVGGAGPANNFPAGRYLILRSASDRTVCTMSQTQPTELPLHFTETGDLQSSAQTLGKTVEKEVEVVPAGATTTLRYFDYGHAAYVDTVQKYESFYKDQSSSIYELTSLENSTPPRIMVIQEGELPIGPSTAIASAVTLLRIGTLESKVQDSLGREKRVDWGDVGTVTFLSGKSKVISSGGGKLVCLMSTCRKPVVVS